MTYIKIENEFFRIYRTELDHDRIYIYLKHHITSKKDIVFVDRQSVYWDYFLHLMTFVGDIPTDLFRGENNRL